MIDRKFEFHPAAELETLRATEWYKARSPNAAHRFVMDIEEGIRLILEDPARWPLSETGTRRLVLKRFPYSLIYRSRADIVEILAVMHHRRKPGYWVMR